MASIDGEWAATAEPDFNGVEVSFNPKRVRLFVDSQGFAVRRADQVTICGHRAFLRGAIEYYTDETAPKKVGDQPCCAKFYGAIPSGASCVNQ
jgi:hypothetical protein